MEITMSDFTDEELLQIIEFGEADRIEFKGMKMPVPFTDLA